ncbi:Mitochondrial coenzyme A diphosphatase NUDT8 [Apodemus speciosus]|uniref:Mitochondrial coenzyme A diphosphatase NUDT8 n=1 Tax=Apodemus speciosus TaxID=105296 RepID=A0ABQ0FRV0_APOSI
MLPDCLSAEDEQRCRQLLARTTARLRSRPAAAAVLVPLCLVRGVPALLYTLRSSRLVGRHKGEVRTLPLTVDWREAIRGYPSLASPSAEIENTRGGKCDPDDQDVIHTALRETQEELGLEVSKEHVWGVLQPVYDREKATIVPVLASVGPLDLQSLRPNPEEVDDVFELSLAHLLQTQNHGYTHFCKGGHFSYTLPVFLHGPHRVWGLTAVITEFTLKLLAPGIYQPSLAVPELPRG